MVFSSTKCPSGSGVEKRCELPFGLVWTPFREASDESSPKAATIPRCVSCKAYWNPYVATITSPTTRWKCSFCGQANDLQDLSLQSQTSPTMTYRHLAPTQDRNGVPIANAPPFSVTSIDESATTYVVVMDANLSPSEALAAGRCVEESLILMRSCEKNINLGLVVFDGAVRAYRIAQVPGLAAADVIRSYERGSVEEEEDKVVIDPYTMLRGKPYIQMNITSEQDFMTFRHCLWAVYGIDDPGKENDQTATSKPAPLSRKEQLRRRKLAREKKQQEESDPALKPVLVESPWVTQSSAHPPKHAKRCTAEAVQTAMDLVTVSSASVGRVLLFTNGCPNVGDASVVSPEAPNKSIDVIDAVQMARAVDFCDALGQYGQQDMGPITIGMDVFCTGANELGLQVYQSLVEPSGGYCLPHLSFLTPHLGHNLQKVIHNTTPCPSITDETGDGEIAADCYVEIRSSSFITASQLFGPGEIIDAGEDTDPSATTRVRLGRVDPMTTISMMLDVNDDSPHDHAFFQLVSYRHLGGGSTDVRVSTHRLPTAKAVSDFLDGVDERVVSILLAKSAVYRSLYGREDCDGNDTRMIPSAADVEQLAYDTQLDLDATIQRISGAFRLLALERGTKRMSMTDENGEPKAHTNSSLDFAFPPELAGALRRLYHMRRGPFLSPGPMQSMDDRAEIRSLFLRFPLDECLAMMAPKVWSSLLKMEPPALEQVPPETLALWEKSVLAADHFNKLFVWSGKGANHSEYDVIRDEAKAFVTELSKQRFPMPEIHMLNEGDSMGRRFTSLLAPSHADPAQQQVVNFPALASLQPDEMETLRGKFRFHDNTADASFRTWFWSVASATNASRNEGLSLCD